MRAAAAALAGLALAGACGRPAPVLAVLLLGLAAAGRQLVPAALALGLLAGWWTPPPVAPLEGRPVVLVGALERPWRRIEGGWLAGLAVRHYRQGGRVEAWRQTVRLTLPGEAPPPPSRGLRVRGLLRRAPGLANGAPVKPGPWRMRLKSRRFVEARRAAGCDLPWRIGLWARGRIETALAAAADRPGASLARALALGDAAALPQRWRRGLRAAGLAHLVALSGLHVGLVAGLCLVAAAPWRRGFGALLASAAAVAFLLIAGARPALLRATAMGVLAAGCLALGRRPHGLALLATLAACLALADPPLLGEPGYQLTCSATAGILWLTPRLEAAWSGLAGWLRRPLALTCGAQLGGLPWALPAFAMISPLAPLWNLLAVPWTAVCLSVCLAWAALALLWPAAAGGALPLLDAAARPFAAVGSLPPAISRPLPLPLPFWAALAGGGALAFVLLRPARRWPLAAVGLVTCRLLAPPPALEVRMLDVGQGEAVLLRDGPRAVLVDGGGWRHGDLGGRVLLPALARAGVRRLDVMVLTHPDLDHCGGLLDLASYLPVAEVWAAPGWRASRCALELTTSPGVRLRPLWAGEAARVGRWGFLALHPGADGWGSGNDRSLVLAATAPGLRVLLTGDVSAAAERRLLRRWPAPVLRADVLKVPHHGSRSSTSPGLLATARPRLALISCGLGNPYGHPASEVLRRLHRAGVAVLRTDRSGEIVLRRGAAGRWRLSTPGLPRPG